MSHEPLNFEEYKRRREENASTVQCAKCGKWIVATATRCPECGVYFQGEAQDFAHPSDSADRERKSPVWVIVLAVLLLVAMLLIVIGLR